MVHYTEKKQKQPRVGQCYYRRRDPETGRFLGYCERTGGWGRDSDRGRCVDHYQDRPGAPKGSSNAAGHVSGGAPKGSSNAAKHGAYAGLNAFYNNIADDHQRAVIDKIFQDYLNIYNERHGEVPYGDKVKLFGISVNLVKETSVEQWALDKPESVQSGNPLIDREVTYTEDGRQVKFKETAAHAALKTLSADTRQWLKALELTPTSEETKAIQDNLDAYRDIWGTDRDEEPEEDEEDGDEEG